MGKHVQIFIGRPAFSCWYSAFTRFDSTKQRRISMLRYQKIKGKRNDSIVVHSVVSALFSLVFTVFKNRDFNEKHVQIFIGRPSFELLVLGFYWI